MIRIQTADGLLKFAPWVAASTLFAVALLAPVLALANATGRLDATSDPDINGGADCSDCHGPTNAPLDDPTFARIEGPGTVIAGDVVPLELIVSQDSGNNRLSCGFGLSVTDGDLSATEGSTEVRFSAGSGTNQLVHTQSLSSICTDIDFEWTAPSVSSPTNVTFYAGAARTFVGGPRASDFAANASLTLTVLPELPQLRELLAFGSLIVEATGGVADMGNPVDVIVSSDSKNVYVAADSEDAIVTFDREGGTGALDNPRVLKDTSSGGTVDGLRGPVAVVANSTGFMRQVYVATDTDNQVVTAFRGAQGTLSFVDDRNPAIRSHTDAVLFPDGLVLAISGDDASDDGVGLMNFDTAGREGLPTTFQTRRAGSGGIGTSDFTAQPAAMAVSPDSQFLYVGGSSPSGIFILGRDPAALTMSLIVSDDPIKNPIEDHVEDHVGGVQSLGAPDALALSPDGKHLYAVNDSTDAVVAFARDAVTGELTFVQALQQGEVGTTGLQDAIDVAVSPNGRFVFVASDLLDGSVLVLDRDPITGRVTPADTVFDSDPDMDGLRLATALTPSPDGRHLYVAAQEQGPGANGSVVVLIPEPGVRWLGFVALAVLVGLGGRVRHSPPAHAEARCSGRAKTLRRRTGVDGLQTDASSGNLAR